MAASPETPPPKVPSEYQTSARSSEAESESTVKRNTEPLTQSCTFQSWFPKHLTADDTKDYG